MCQTCPFYLFQEDGFYPGRSDKTGETTVTLKTAVIHHTNSETSCV